VFGLSFLHHTPASDNLVTLRQLAQGRLVHVLVKHYHHPLLRHIQRIYAIPDRFWNGATNLIYDLSPASLLNWLLLVVSRDTHIPQSIYNYRPVSNSASAPAELLSTVPILDLLIGQPAQS
jgi:hypothetical protein